MFFLVSVTSKTESDYRDNQVFTPVPSSPHAIALPKLSYKATLVLYVRNYLRAFPDTRPVGRGIA